jgi:hypothetical protein
MYSRSRSTPASIGFSYPSAIGSPYADAQQNLPMQRTPWDRIKEAMTNKGLKPTQTECAKLLDIKQPSVWEWANSNGSPSIDNAITLAKKLNVCVEWILTGGGPKRPGPPMEPAAQALWDVWGRIPPEDRPQVVGFAEAKARPSQAKPTPAPRSAPKRRIAS